VAGDGSPVPARFGDGRSELEVECELGGGSAGERALSDVKSSEQRCQRGKEKRRKGEEGQSVVATVNHLVQLGPYFITSSKINWLTMCLIFLF
jgi:hypothetical protein